MRFLAIVLLVLASQSVSAAFSSTITCSDPHCREGTEANITFLIWNNINATTHVASVLLQEAETKTIFASYHPNLQLGPNATGKAVFPWKIRPPIAGVRTFDYLTCIEAVIITDKIDDPAMICPDAKRSMTVLPLSKIECEEDSDCKNGACDTRFYKCRQNAADQGSLTGPLILLAALAAAFGIGLLLRKRKKEEFI